MSISRAVLAGLAERAPFSGGVESIASSADGVSVRCRVSAADGCGCALKELECFANRKSKLSTKALSDFADALAGKVTYLMEPLRLVELDAPAGRALVLSKNPKIKAGVTTFYSLLADVNGRTALTRLSFDRASRSRSAIDFQLSHDQLEQLIDDLVEISEAIA